MKELRIVEVNNNGNWVEVAGMESLVVGDLFRMFEPHTNDPVLNDDSKGEFKVIETPKFIKGVWGVVAEAEPT